MIVVVQGTKSFSDYSVFLSGIRSALLNRDEDDKEFTVFTAGPLNINNMAMEFVNVTERSLKSKGIKTKLVKIPPKWISENHEDIDFFGFFCKTKEPVSDIATDMNKKDVNVQVYRQY
jgi:hypothetical protein